MGGWKWLEFELVEAGEDSGGGEAFRVELAGNQSRLS
jgi:hypothetical protein